MANKSSIEWTDVTWNPVRGCTKISAGCKNCYASAFAERFRGVADHPYEHGFDIRTVPHKLTEPFTWPKPSTVFVNSMSDLFHPEIPEDFLESVVRVMVANPWHTFQVLTKRAERLAGLLCGRLAFAAEQSHIWWGVSVEDVKNGVPRIEHLRRSCAAVKFLSVEPLLEDLGTLRLNGIDWVIVGGESGRGARPIEESWVRNVQRDCSVADVPFFFKQWGGVHKKSTGRLLGGRTYDSMPNIIRSPIPERSVRAKLLFDFTSRIKKDHEFVQIQAGS